MRIPLCLISVSIAAFLTGSGRAQDWVQWDTASGGNGHWYKAVVNTNGLNWSQVDLLARSEGGHLATISSDAENQFVFSLINSPEFFSGAAQNGSGPAIGGYQPDGEPAPDIGWAWETGEPWIYTNWAPGQPDLSTETRLHYFSGSQGVPSPLWNNISATDSNLGGYVIERESKTNSSATGFYGQAFVGASGGTLLSPLLGTPTRTFVTVYDSKGKMVGRLPSNPVGQFFAYEKPGNYTLIATQPGQPFPAKTLSSTNSPGQVMVQITVNPNFMTPVQINYQLQAP
jgi:hypothetical protein